MDDASITGALNDQMPRLAVVCPPIKIPGYVPAFCKCWYFSLPCYLQKSLIF